MSHSPEPWTFRPVAERDPHSRFDPLIGRAGGWVARLFCEGSSVRGLTSLAPPLEVAEANAERIVACVNACAGIPTPLLQTHGRLAFHVQVQMDIEASLNRRAAEFVYGNPANERGDA